MNRLLQGDVGAGKTIVALLAALVAMENGLQVAFMAPTEILAEQHFLNISRLLQQLAVPRRAADRLGRRPRSGASNSPRSKRARLHLVVGTHALVQGDVRFKQLGLVVIDEQHRFGVLQRATLATKGLRPDVLVMTATPIPRTLALTLYGDLDVSVIRELPPGRLPVRTIAKPESRRDEIHAFVRGAARGRPAGLRRLSARRGVGEGRPQGGDRDGRPPRAGRVPGIPGRPAARPDEGRRARSGS